jgi:hypothetical protein
LFAAGDGNLYRCGFGADDEGSTSPDSGTTGQSAKEGLRQVIWNCPCPGTGAVVISDPVWPVDPRLGRLLFATLSYNTGPRDNSVKVPAQLWWFLMSPDGSAIEASGPMLEKGLRGSADNVSAKRFPNLAVAADGTICIVYLSRPPGHRHMRLEATLVEVDAKSGRPHLVSDQLPRVLAEECATVPTVFSADGKSVFAISVTSGQVVQYPAEVEDALQGIKVARK